MFRLGLRGCAPVIVAGVLVGALVGVPASRANGLTGSPTPGRRPAVLPAVVPFRTLEQAVRSGALDRRVLAEMHRRGDVDALLILDGESALREAVGGAPSGPGQARAVLDVTRPAYVEQKQRVLGRLTGVESLRSYSALPIAFVRFHSEAALLGTVNDPEVVGVAANRALRADLAQSLPLIRQPQAAADHTGAGTSVAVLDTGVDYTRAAFSSCAVPGSPSGCKVVYAQDFAPNDGSLDDNGHGTNVAGIVVGVAPSTQILALDVFNGDAAYDTDVIAAINFAIANRTTYNIRAMNLSIGDNGHNAAQCSGGTNPYVAAFANARAAGIMPVVSAGNDAIVNGSYVDGLAAPACTPGAMSVGAVYDSNVGGRSWGTAPYACSDPSTAADQITCFSQSASYLTVYAPGALIRAAGLTMGGTSQAAPHVAGAVAVLAAASPGATLDAISTALANSGPAIFDPANNTTKHRLDLPDAVAAVAPSSSGSDLSITKTDAPDPVTPGGTITYTVTATNNGPAPATGVTVTDTLPASVTLVSASGCTGTTTLSCAAGDLAAGASATVQIVVTAPSAGPVSNTAAVTATSTDPVSSNNTATATTAVGGATTCTVTGTSSGEILQGTVGDDVICGLGGTDVLLGGGGNDTLIGGGGFDFVDYETASSGVVVDLGAGTATGDGTDSLRGIEGVAGSAHADTLTGDAGDNDLFGLGGADHIVGGGGFDFARFDFAPKSVTVDLSAGTASGEGSDTLVGIEGVTGSAGGDVLIGDNRANSFFGLKGDDGLGGFGGDDLLVGGPGADTLTGGRGNDDMFGGPGSDLCVQGPGRGKQNSC